MSQEEFLLSNKAESSQDARRPEESKRVLPSRKQDPFCRYPYTFYTFVVGDALGIPNRLVRVHEEEDEAEFYGYPIHNLEELANDGESSSDSDFCRSEVPLYKKLFLRGGRIEKKRELKRIRREEDTRGVVMRDQNLDRKFQEALEKT